MAWVNNTSQTPTEKTVHFALIQLHKEGPVRRRALYHGGHRWDRHQRSHKGMTIQLNHSDRMPLWDVSPLCESLQRGVRRGGVISIGH